MKSEEKFIIRILVFVIIGLLFVGYGRYVQKSTIESAVLTEINDSEYRISFDGEENVYTWED